MSDLRPDALRHLPRPQGASRRRLRDARRVPCRGCGRAGVLVGGRRYCGDCRRVQCPECGKFANRHHPTCRYEHRQRRGERRRRPVVRIVTEEAYLALWEAHRARLRREAGAILGPMWAEDAVSDVFTHLWERLDEIAAPLTLAYLLTAVRHRCWAMMRPLVWQRLVYYDPVDLVALEAATLALAMGRPHEGAVRLPEEEAPSLPRSSAGGEPDAKRTSR